MHTYQAMVRFYNDSAFSTSISTAVTIQLLISLQLLKDRYKHIIIRSGDITTRDCEVHIETNQIKFLFKIREIGITSIGAIIFPSKCPSILKIPSNLMSPFILLFLPITMSGSNSFNTARVYIGALEQTCKVLKAHYNPYVPTFIKIHDDNTLLQLDIIWYLVLSL